MKKLAYLLPAALLVLASCASSKSAYRLAGEWQVVNINGQGVTPSDQTPFLGFDLNENRVYGFTGCNRLTGGLDVKAFLKGHPDFSKLGMTRMLCQDDKYESPFMDALNKVVESELADGEMLLKDQNGNVVLTLKKKP